MIFIYLFIYGIHKINYMKANFNKIYEPILLRIENHEPILNEVMKGIFIRLLPIIFHLLETAFYFSIHSSFIIKFIGRKIRL